MDGAIPAFGADSMRRFTARFNLSSGANSAHSLQSGLFEQLLSAPPPSRIDRQSPSANASQANSSIDPLAQRDRDSSSSNVTHRSDRDDKPDEDKQPEQSAVTAQPAGLPPTPTVAPQPAEGVTSEGTLAEDTASKSGSDGGTGELTLEEMSAESSKIAADQAKMLPTDTQEGAALETDALGRDAKPQGGARDAIQDPTVGTSPDAANAESELPTDDCQSAQLGDVPEIDNVAAETISASNVTGEELSSRELGDVRRAHERDPAQAQENATSADGRSQARGQVEAASTRGGKSRDDRREKWFQRDADNSSSAQGESNVASKTQAAQAGIANGSLSAGALSGQSGAMAAAMGEGSVNGSSAAESAASPALPDSLAQMQPPAMNAAVMATDRRLAATENLGSGAPGGERPVAQSSGVEGSETSRSPSSALRVDAKPAVQDAQRSDALTQAERVRLVQRVSRSFARLGPMGGEISLKLHPPQLGALNVQVRLEGRSMTAKLTTESSAARDAILESLPVLRKRLAEQGFEISSFQVEVADSQSDINSGSDSSRPGSDQAGGRDNRQAAGQGTDYRRLAAQQRQASDRYDVSPNSVAASALAWEMPRGVDVQA